MPAVCEQCGEEALTDSARFCVGCGALLVPVEVDEVEVGDVAVEAPEPEPAATWSSQVRPGTPEPEAVEPEPGEPAAEEPDAEPEPEEPELVPEPDGHRRVLAVLTYLRST